MRPTETQIAAAKDFRTAMKQWLSADRLPVNSNTKRYATVAQWKEFYTRSAEDIGAACQWLNDAVIAMQAGKPAPETRPETVKPVIAPETKPETKGTETMTQDHNQLAAQLAAIMAQLAAGAGVNAAEVEKIVDQRLAAAGAVKHEFILDGLTVGAVDGGHPMLPDVIDWLALKVPVYAYGPAGSGKSSIGRMAAKALNLKCFQYGSIFSKYELIGMMDAKGEYHRTDFRDWFEHGGLLVLDEIDGSDPRAIVAFNDALRGPSGTPFSFPDGTVEKHDDCRLLVSANTIGKGANSQYVGRYKMDAASLNGFVHIEIEYDQKIERALSRGDLDWLDICRETRKALADLSIEHIISPRQVDFGSRLLTSKQGDRKALLRRVVNQCLAGGLSFDQWAMVISRSPLLAEVMGA